MGTKKSSKKAKAVVETSEDAPVVKQAAPAKKPAPASSHAIRNQNRKVMRNR